MQHSQHTHTTEIINATTWNTPNQPTKEKSTEIQLLEVAENHSSTAGRQPAGKSAPLLGRHLSQIFSPILLFPSSSNPKWGSGGDAGLKERNRRRCGIERERERERENNKKLNN